MVACLRKQRTEHVVNVSVSASTRKLQRRGGSVHADVLPRQHAEARDPCCTHEGSVILQAASWYQAHRCVRASRASLCVRWPRARHGARRPRILPRLSAGHARALARA